MPPRVKRKSSEAWTKQLTIMEIQRRRLVEISVTYRDSSGLRTRDLFGCIDILAVDTRKQITYAIQFTSRSNLAARVKKVKANRAVPILLEGGWRVLCWGWKAEAGKEPILTEREIELGDL